MVKTCFWDTVPAKNLAFSQTLCLAFQLFQPFRVIIIILSGHWDSWFYSCFLICSSIYKLSLIREHENYYIIWCGLGASHNFLMMSSCFLLELEMSEFFLPSVENLFCINKHSVIKISHKINVNAFSGFIHLIQGEQSHIQTIAECQWFQAWAQQCCSAGRGWRPEPLL